MTKISAIILAVFFTSFFCFQNNAQADADSSLLLQLPAIFAAAKANRPTTIINENVTVIDENSTDEIVASHVGTTGEMELQLSGDLADSVQDDSILYLLPGLDERFPFGIVGKVVDVTSFSDGTKKVVLEEVSYADVISEASIEMDDIVLDISNFIGVIAPAAVQAATPMSAARHVGIRALLVHALDEAFYLGHGFIESPIEPMTLMLSLAQTAA